MSNIILGASFSHRHLSSLGMNTHQALEAYKELGFTWIRLGCYWDEIETEPGIYDFDIIEDLLLFCDVYNIHVMLTVGMKAPRYPEYYIPKWLHHNPQEVSVQTACLSFIEKTVQALKHHTSIQVWQVENEPLDPSGPEQHIVSIELLRREIELVRATDPERKIAVNFWANDLSDRNLYGKVISYADIIGLDLYPRQPVKIFGNHYRFVGPRDSKRKISQIVSDIKSKRKEVWISELQAEPWEPDEVVTLKHNPPSCLPEHLLSNITYAASLNPDTILLWGFEWWYKKKREGDARYWNQTIHIIRSVFYTNQGNLQ